MSDLAHSLALLQLGDSFFPSGATSFSWGLETLRADGLVVRAADVEALIEGQIRHRWASFDRPALIASYRASGDLDRIADVDREIDAATLAREARDGGRRIGSALLKVHAGMGTPGAVDYRERVQRGDACGQMTAVHGLIGHATGLDETAVCALSAYGLAVGTIGAALRVGLLGHVEGQAILARMRAVVDEAVASPLPAVDACHAYTPMAEIAMMRHETGSGRMFAS